MYDILIIYVTDFKKVYDAVKKIRENKCQSKTGTSGFGNGNTSF